MPKMTGARLFAEMMRGYEVSHIFFVPAFMLKAFAEMENMPIKRLSVHRRESGSIHGRRLCARQRQARHLHGPDDRCFQYSPPSMRDGFMAGSPIIAITGGPTPQWRTRYA